jgi:peptidoglycan/LPS O-acetylase OafA/YrhL
VVCVHPHRDRVSGTRSNRLPDGLAGATIAQENFLVKGVDCSYGIYLYGFPVQQAVAQLFPRTWYANLVLNLPLCFHGT